MPGYTEDEARRAVAESISLAEALRRLGLRPAGGNFALLKKWLASGGIPTEHFDPNASRRANAQRAARPLKEVLVEKSSYSRSHLKDRLYREGIKDRKCERCGQGELGCGEPMSLILDHKTGSAATTG